jgi:hypothetical protein
MRIFRIRACRPAFPRPLVSELLFTAKLSKNEPTSSVTDVKALPFGNTHPPRPGHVALMCRAVSPTHGLEGIVANFITIVKRQNARTVDNLTLSGHKRQLGKELWRQKIFAGLAESGDSGCPALGSRRTIILLVWSICACPLGPWRLGGTQEALPVEVVERSRFSPQDEGGSTKNPPTVISLNRPIERRTAIRAST